MEEFLKYRWAYAALFAASAADFAIQSFVSSSYGINHGRGSIGYAFTIIPLISIWLLYVPIKAVVTKRPDPASWTLETYRANGWWFALVAALLIAGWLKASTVASLKTIIPQVVPFYADPALAQFDRLLFGADPWRLTHSVIGKTGTLVLDYLYFLWHPVLITFNTWMILSRRPRLQLQALGSGLLAWTMIGGVLAMAFSSVGPMFYQQFYNVADFAGLREAIDGTIAERGAEFLTRKHGTGTFGSGISAFPSMHVALSMWEVLILHSAFKNRYVTGVGVLWLAITWFSSVHLGWHYTTDGLGAIIAMFGLWKFVGWAVDSLAVHERGKAAEGTVYPLSEA